MKVRVIVNSNMILSFPSLASCLLVNLSLLGAKILVVNSARSILALSYANISFLNSPHARENNSGRGVADGFYVFLARLDSYKIETIVS